jgi:hypothetical protein
MDLALPSRGPKGAIQSPSDSDAPAVRGVGGPPMVPKTQAQIERRRALKAARQARVRRANRASKEAHRWLVARRRFTKRIIAK